MDNLMTAASAAGVGHAVILSIVGADQVPGLVYYRPAGPERQRSGQMAGPRRGETGSTKLAA